MDPTVGQLYAPLFPKEAWAGVSIQRDIPYGTDSLQKLDVFAADGAQGKKLPVLLFVHGGGFTRGDKHGDFYPDNITLWAAKNGMVGVNIDYRLAPKDPWPAGVNDLTSAIAWVHANIAQYGGDPNRIVLFGALGWRQPCRRLRRPSRGAGRGGILGQRRDHPLTGVFHGDSVGFGSTPAP
ncbi:MAG: alpha/beta hydrolase [Steroidobacteraceae bacterium]